MYEFHADWRIRLPYGDYECRMAILATLWRIRMPISECCCPKAIMNANWPFWRHYSEFECRLVILAALSAKLNDLFILSHALCAKLNDLSLLLHALSAKLDGKTYIKKCNYMYMLIGTNAKLRRLNLSKSKLMTLI